MARSNISSDKRYRNVEGVKDKTIRGRLSCRRLSHDGLAKGSGMGGTRSAVRGAVTKVNLRRSHARRVGMTLTMFLNCPLKEIGIVKEWVGLTVEKFSRIYWPVPK